VSHRYAALSTSIDKTGPLQGQGPHVLLHTWVDETCFGKNGVFVDRYFGRLVDWLQERGHTVHIVPWLYNIKRPKRKAFSWLRQSDKRFLFPHDYHKFVDFFKACVVGIRLLLVPGGKVLFNGIDVSGLVTQERFKQTGGSLYPAMYLSLPRRLMEAGYEFDVLIDVFEGMVPEKALLLGMRRSFPNVFSVGYQHTMFSRNLLCYFTHGKRNDVQVLPDRVVCTGPLTRDFLIRGGLPEDRVVVGCALRYEYLWNKQQVAPNGAKTRDGSQVLLTLPLLADTATEIIRKLALAVADLTKTVFLVKPHPMMDSSFVSDSIRKSGWSSNYKIVEGSMDLWLTHSDVLVSAASATALEALSAGVPPVIIGSDTALDLNPLDWFDIDYARAFYEPQEILQRIEDLLQMDDAERERMKAVGLDLLRNCLEPVSTDSLRAFLR
jgi:hypothetical protein